MSYTKAKLIIWNHKNYSIGERQQAAAIILSNMTAAPEDVYQAQYVI